MRKLPIPDLEFVLRGDGKPFSVRGYYIVKAHSWRSACETMIEMDVRKLYHLFPKKFRYAFTIEDRGAFFIPDSSGGRWEVRAKITKLSRPLVCCGFGEYIHDRNTLWYSAFKDPQKAPCAICTEYNGGVPSIRTCDSKKDEYILTSPFVYMSKVAAGLEDIREAWGYVPTTHRARAGVDHEGILIPKHFL